MGHVTDVRRRLRRALSRLPGLLPLARLIVATIRISLRYRVTGLASEAGFFTLLSLPPLVLGLFGGLGYVGGCSAPTAVDAGARDIKSMRRNSSPRTSSLDARSHRGRRARATGASTSLSVGFVLSLWSGSRALNVFVDTISIMYGQ